MNLLQRAALLAAIGVSAVIAGAVSFHGPSAQAALGGPVIIGGDDLTDHGCNDGEFNEEGWLYMQRALENIEPNVTRSNDGSIAALGSADVGGDIICSDAGSAIFHAAAAVGLTVTYYDGHDAIDGFFADLESGASDPAVIWIAGTGADNNIDDGDEDDSGALTENAQAISDFVSEGGGLFSHGTEYGWLFALLPDALATGEGDSDDLYFTPEGLDALPALTEDDINAGPWHNHFEGDFGGLQVLVRSNFIDDALGDDAAVILGGAQVTFEENPTEEPDATSTPCIPPLVGYRCDGTSGGGGGSNPTSTPAASQPTAVSTVAAATVVSAQPTRPTGVVVTAPDTGAGPGDGDSGSMLALLVMAAGGAAIAGAGALTLQARRAR
jgi:hypothetical protein